MSVGLAELSARWLWEMTGALAERPVHAMHRPTPRMPLASLKLADAQTRL